jgi:hypothetical protein
MLPASIFFVLSTMLLISGCDDNTLPQSDDNGTSNNPLIEKTAASDPTVFHMGARRCEFLRRFGLVVNFQAHVTTSSFHEAGMPKKAWYGTKAFTRNGYASRFKVDFPVLRAMTAIRECKS